MSQREFKFSRSVKVIKKSLGRKLSVGTFVTSNGHHQAQNSLLQSLTTHLKNVTSNHKNPIFPLFFSSDSQTSQDSSWTQIDEPTGPAFTSKFLQKWQIDFEPLFSSPPDILHQNHPHSDLRHTSKYRFPKFWLKTVESSYVFGQSKWREAV